MKLHWINWVAAGGCLVTAIAFTVADKSMDKIAVLAVLGIANVGFILLRHHRTSRMDLK